MFGAIVIAIDLFVIFISRADILIPALGLTTLVFVGEDVR
jgi:hypothetical protein